MASNVTELNTEGSDARAGVSIDGTPNGDIAKAHAEMEDEGKEQATPLITKDPEFMQMLRDVAKNQEKIAAKRSELNAESQADFSRLDIYGLNRKAIKAAINCDKMSPEQRENYDLSYHIQREAMGNPVKAQDDLFEAAARAAVNSHQASKKH